MTLCVSPRRRPVVECVAGTVPDPAVRSAPFVQRLSPDRRSCREKVNAAPRNHKNPMPMKKMAGMNFQLAVSWVNARIPQPTHTMPIANSMNGDDGRLPTCGRRGSGSFSGRSGRRSGLTRASYRPTE